MTSRSSFSMAFFQQLGLQGQRQLCDLVEDQGPALGEAEQPLAGLMGPGEGALDVPEQLALQQIRRDRPAVDGDEASGAAAAGVDGARGQLLAGAGFPLDEDRGRPGCHALDDGADLVHGGAVAHQPAQGLVLLDLPMQKEVLAGDAPPLHAAPGCCNELLNAEGFEDEVAGTRPQGTDGAVRVGIGGHEDHLQAAALVAQALYPGKPVRAGGPDVGDEQIEVAAAQQVLRLGSIRSALHQGEVMGKAALHEVAHRRLGVSTRTDAPAAAAGTAPPCGSLGTTGSGPPSGSASGPMARAGSEAIAKPPVVQPSCRRHCCRCTGAATGSPPGEYANRLSKSRQSNWDILSFGPGRTGQSAPSPGVSPACALGPGLGARGPTPERARWHWSC
jgi:hypothetical protein